MKFPHGVFFCIKLIFHKSFMFQKYLSEYNESIVTHDNLSYTNACKMDPDARWSSYWTWKRQFKENVSTLQMKSEVPMYFHFNKTSSRLEYIINFACKLWEFITVITIHHETLSNMLYAFEIFPEISNCSH